MTQPWSTATSIFRASDSLSSVGATISRLSLFGSILTEDFGPDSDIDVLVEFETGKGPSLLGFAGMQLELAGMLERAVHLHTPSMLDPHWRAQVELEAEVQYAA